MSKKSKGGFYAVHKGEKTGVFRTWDQCEPLVKTYRGAKYKKFSTEAEANYFVAHGVAPSGPQTSSSSGTSTAVPAGGSAAPGSTADSKGKKRAFGPEVSNPEEWNVVYSDGACKGNGKKDPVAGVGVYWGPNDERNLWERCPGAQTNNRAELIAILRVLETLPPDDTHPLIIRTDSQYSIQCFRDWIRSWERNGWRNAAGQPVKNTGVIKCTSLLLDIRGALGQRIVFEYVKGHSGDPGNDGADLMANQGAMLPEVEDRDWDALYEELQKKMRQIGTRPKVPFQVKAPKDITTSSAPEEPAAKIRKLNAEPQAESRAKAPEASSAKGKERAVPQTPVKPQPSSSRQLPSTPATTAASSARTQPSPVKPSQQQQATSQASPEKSYDHIWNPENKKPLQAIMMTPPIVAASVDAKDVNLDDYADCLLDSDDLEAELLAS